MQSISETLQHILVLKRREQSSYLYCEFYHPLPPRPPRHHHEMQFHNDDVQDQDTETIYNNSDSNKRCKLCNWVFNIVDHFDLSRDTATISMNIFDRFMATRGNQCTPNFALLAVITSLYTSIKVHEQMKIKSDYLATLTRGRFDTSDIEQMEAQILRDVNWLLHPPTPVSFLSSLVYLLPEHEVTTSARRSLFEHARYLSELTIFDPYFIGHQASIVALATIMTLLEDEVHQGRISPSCQTNFLLVLDEDAKMMTSSEEIQKAMKRLRHTVYQTHREHLYHHDYDDAFETRQQESFQNQHHDDEKRIRNAPSPTSICKHFS